MTRQDSITSSRKGKRRSAGPTLQTAEIRRNLKYFCRLFSPEEIIRLMAMPTDDFLIVVKRRLVMLAAYLLMAPNVSSRDRLFLIDLLKRYRHDLQKNSAQIRRPVR